MSRQHRDHNATPVFFTTVQHVTSNVRAFLKRCMPDGGSVSRNHVVRARRGLVDIVRRATGMLVHADGMTRQAARARADELVRTTLVRVDSPVARRLLAPTIDLRALAAEPVSSKPRPVARRRNTQRRTDSPIVQQLLAAA